MLVGDYNAENEADLFHLLLYAEKGMYMSTSDGLGTSKSVVFDL